MSLNILISEPNAQPHMVYLPYQWAILKTYCETHGDIAKGMRWLDPLYQYKAIDALERGYGDTPIDVLGLSCYVWNWPVQLEIARRVKARNPNCLVVAGGPEPDHKDETFFAKHRDIDVIAFKDGEITFARILEKLAANDRDWSDVPGLYLPTADRASRVTTRPAEVPSNFEHSPYVCQTPYYERFMKSHEGEFISIVLETTRGCPYSCSFCDWGQNTMSKLRRFDMERVRAELEWVGRMQIDFCFLADANLGILERDLEVAELFNSVRDKYGKPRFLYYSPAKNHPARTMEISRKFYASGLSNIHTFAIQHTREPVLASIHRANISTDKQRQIAQYMHEQGIPTDVQLIVGLPGDTYELWRACFADLMEWGIHEYYYMFSFSLLPNAPAAQPEYMREWQIETLLRRLPLESPGKRALDGSQLLTEAEIVVASKCFSRADWVRMKTYAAFIRALHNSSVTRLVAMYLRHTHEVPFEEFYTNVIDDYVANSGLGLHQAVGNMLGAYLASPACDEEMAVEELPEYAFHLETSKWILYRIGVESDRFFSGLKQYLRARYPFATNVGSAVDYQKSILILPRGTQEDGYSFVTDHDWISYFERAQRLTHHVPLAEPQPASGATVLVTDERVADYCTPAGGFDLASEEGRRRCGAWIDSVLLYRNCAASMNFRGLVLRRAGESKDRRARLPVLAP